MWVPQSPTLHMMSCTDHAFLWCPSCFSPSAHTEPHSTKLPSVHHLHHTVFSQKFTFQVRTFWQSWHTTLRMHCISHSSALFPALWSSAKKMCSGHCQSTLSEHTWAQCPACLQPVQVDPAKTARTGPSAQAHLWTVHCNTRMQRAVLIQWN